MFARARARWLNHEITGRTHGTPTEPDDADFLCVIAWLRPVEVATLDPTTGRVLATPPTVRASLGWKS